MKNFITKAGAQRYASQYGIFLVAPDTSPRGCNIPGEADSWDFGVGAGFYVDATEEKWKKNYNMYSYVTKELSEIVNKHFPVIPDRQSISGHSMGGHGALICTLKNPGEYKSCSAFSPICNPVICPWGKKAFSGYLGSDEETWKAYDATELTKSYTGPSPNILIDQGTEDKFLEEQLLPHSLQAAKHVQVRMQKGYDHSYYFISTFIEDHIAHHAQFLNL